MTWFCFSLLPSRRPNDSYIDTTWKNIIYQRGEQNKLPSAEIIKRGIPDRLDEPARRLITDMLQPEPEKRLRTLDALKKHPFMQNFEF